MSSKLRNSSCWIVLIYNVWLSEVSRLMILNKFDFRSSLNLHHLKLRKYGHVRQCLRFARMMTIYNTCYGSFFSVQFQKSKDIKVSLF